MIEQFLDLHIDMQSKCKQNERKMNSGNNYESFHIIEKSRRKAAKIDKWKSTKIAKTNDCNACTQSPGKVTTYNTYRIALFHRYKEWRQQQEKPSMHAMNESFSQWVHSLTTLRTSIVKMKAVTIRIVTFYLSTKKERRESKWSMLKLHAILLLLCWVSL